MPALRRSPNWEVEPLRWLVVRYMQNDFLRVDKAAEAGRRRPVGAALAEYLGSTKWEIAPDVPLRELTRSSAELTD